MRTFALALALLMHVANDGLLLAEVVPEVFIEERKEKSSLDDDIKQLKKEAEEAGKLKNYTKAIDLYERILESQEKSLGPNHTDIANSLTDLADLYHDYQIDGMTIQRCFQSHMK